MDLLLGLNVIPPQSVFCPNAAEVVKFYITHTLKKPHRFPVHEHMNSNLKKLPGLFKSPKENFGNQTSYANQGC
jgi:hypothetical protein